MSEVERITADNWNARRQRELNARRAECRARMMHEAKQAKRKQERHSGMARLSYLLLGASGAMAAATIAVGLPGVSLACGLVAAAALGGVAQWDR